MQFDLYSAIYAILIAFLANIILSPIIIPFLTKLKFGQNVRDDGPKSHLIKAGTPTMGGIIILISLIISSLFFLKGNYDAIIVLFVTIGYGIVGFIDDYIKVVKKRSLGLRAYQKIIGQLIITIIFLIYIYKCNLLLQTLSSFLYCAYFWSILKDPQSEDPQCLHSGKATSKSLMRNNLDANSKRIFIPSMLWSTVPWHVGEED